MTKLGQSDLPYRMLRLTWSEVGNQDSFLAVLASHPVQMYNYLPVSVSVPGPGPVPVNCFSVGICHSFNLDLGESGNTQTKDAKKVRPSSPVQWLRSILLSFPVEFIFGSIFSKLHPTPLSSSLSCCKYLWENSMDRNVRSLPSAVTEDLTPITYN